MNKQGYHRDVVLVLVASFFYTICPIVVTPLITGYSESLGASATLMGIIGGMMSLCSLICRPFAGNLADKISKYKLSFMGAVLMLLGCLGYIVAQSPGILILARLINGVGFALCSVCMSTWMSNMLPREKIGSGMGLYGMSNALAMAIGPGIGVSVWKSFGYRVALSIAAVSSVIIMIIIQFVHDKGEPVSEVRTNGKRFQIIDRKILPVTCITMLISIPYCATQSFLVSYTQTRGIDVSVSWFFPFYAIVLLLLRLGLKSQFDKVPFRTFITFSSLSSAISLIFLATMKGYVGLFLAAVFMASGYGLMCSICQSTAILLAGEGRRGIANSTYYVGIDLGMMLGPVLGGFLYGHMPIKMFYPMFLLTVPMALAVCWLSRTCRYGASVGSTAPIETS